MTNRKQYRLIYAQPESTDWTLDNTIGLGTPAPLKSRAEQLRQEGNHTVVIHSEALLQTWRVAARTGDTTFLHLLHGIAQGQAKAHRS